MIFVTIGSAFPFDRLIRLMDDWAGDTGRGAETIAQIGRGAYVPEHMEWRRSLTEADFAETMRRADLVVSHAGMGTAITAMRYGTPLVMLPRRFEAGEHTTDHQMATARWLEEKPGIRIAWDDAELVGRIAEAEALSEQPAAERLDPYAPEVFTDRIRARLLDWTKDGS